jgi:Mn2+/Fe2+ NRAMP family transporter
VTTARHEGTTEAQTSERQMRPSIRTLGPGIIIAATGVGAGDMVGSLVSGSKYGTTLLWAIILGAILKLAITEGIGRWYLATGITPMKGILSLGAWVKWYVGTYLVILGFIYGAAVVSATGLGLNGMMPWLSITQWAVITAVVSFAILMVGRYGVFERVMQALAGFMFVTVVGAAALTAPALGDIVGGLTFTVPEGSLLYVLGLIGGVGGTITLASYGYWLRDKGWSGGTWMKAMRFDVIVGYVLTPVFMMSMMVVGAAMLFGTGQELSGQDGLIPLADAFADRFGEVARWLMLLGFVAATFTSVLGGWNGFSYLFADIVRIGRRIDDADAAAHTTEKSPMFRAFLVWSAFPPLLLLLFGKPVLLVVVYAALGALFMPFFSATLLYMLNSRRVPAAFRNGWLSNSVLGLSLVLFAVLGVQKLIGLV